ncbi:MAG: glycosyltransferase family 39 protein [Nitrososphaerales archaeon]
MGSENKLERNGRPSTIRGVQNQLRKVYASDTRKLAKYSIVLITVAFFILVLIASIQLNPFGKNPRSDEYIYTASAEYMLTQHVCVPYSLSSMPNLQLCNLEHPPLVKEMMAVSIFLLGNNQWGVRLPSMILGTLSIPLVSYIGWKLTRKESLAVMSAALMAFNPLLIGISSIAMLDTGEIFFSLCAFVLYLSSAFGYHKMYKSLLIGCLFGLSILSKEVGVFALVALVTYDFFGKGRLSALKRSALIIVGTISTVAAGLQIYDHYFTNFPNFVSHIVFLVNYGRSISGYYVSTNPDLWLTSLTSKDLGSGLGVLNPMISFAVFVWLPLLALYLFARRSAYSLALPAVLLFWAYFPYLVLFDLVGRDVKYFYSIQMSPALALGAACLYGLIGDRLQPKLRVVLVIAVCAVSFVICLCYWSLGMSVSAN